jgi:hypothetical protein
VTVQLDDFALPRTTFSSLRSDEWRHRSRLVGIAGSVICGVVFLKAPGFPTPDKFLVFATFVAMAWGQATELLKRFVPFVGLLVTYESFRSIAPHLNHRVNVTWMPQVDRAIFGALPTRWLQQHLWTGHVEWYDVLFFAAYLMHFVLPLALGVLVWKRRDSFYWQYMSTYVVLSFAGFVTYVLFPAAPPWMASDAHAIGSVTRVQSHVWQSLGIRDFSLLYDKLSPNAVAAVPSLHSAYSVLFVVVVWRLFGRHWAIPAMAYPVLIWVGTVYQGEHYAIDAILGALYAVAAYVVVEWAFRRVRARRSAVAPETVSAADSSDTPTLAVPSGV